MKKNTDPTKKNSGKNIIILTKEWKKACNFWGRYRGQSAAEPDVAPEEIVGLPEFVVKIGIIFNFYRNEIHSFLDNAGKNKESEIHPFLQLVGKYTFSCPQVMG